MKRLRHFHLSLMSLALWMPSAPAAEHTLTGTVMCGYQGWFAAEGDGTGRGWQHYGFGKPGECHIDMWPDVAELTAEELFTTPFKFADGSAARVFSSAHPRTVRRHFEWMKGAGIDGVFLQRFGVSVKHEGQRAFVDQVLANVRTAARETGRSWAVMYDLSGLKNAEIETVVMQDWKRLRNELRVIDDPTYQRHRGKPVVAVWGIGFGDGRDYTLAESARLLRFLRDNPEFGGMTVMAGVPFGWRTLDRDAAADPQLHEVLKSADIISPWAVGRYRNPAEAEREIGRVHEADAAWCKERRKDYLPVVFPGFSWANLMKARGQTASLDAIPRLGGEFLWSQATARVQRGADMLYVAMFDEMDEGTAIFKCASLVPEGAAGFVSYGSLPADHYLWLTGQIGRLLRKELPPGPLPTR